MKRRALQSAVCLAALALFLGCGGGAGTEGTTVTGKILENGKPIPFETISASGPPSRSIISVELVKGGVVAGRTTLREDGAFTMEGVKPGSYKLVLKKEGMMDPATMMGGGNQDPRKMGESIMDGYQGKYSEANSKFTVEVPNQSTFDIPLIELADAKDK